MSVEAQLALLFLGAYLLGSVPFAVLFGRLKGVNILQFGSGNPGMTNVTRALGPGWGLACFILDVGKGTLPAAAARFIVTDPLHGLDPQLIWFMAGVFAIAGHCASVFLRFRGGKGISTSLGAVIGAAPLLAALCFSVFLVLLAATRYVSLASVVGVSASIVFDLALPGNSRQLLPVFVLLSLFVVYRHRKNFKRLRDGDEPKFTFRKTHPPPASGDAGGVREPPEPDDDAGKDEPQPSESV